MLTSCASVDVGRSFPSVNIAKLQAGTTTKAQVLEMFGSPFVRIDKAQWDCPRVGFGDEETAVIFRYVHGHGNLLYSAARFLQVEFNEAGLLVDYHYSSAFRKDRTPEAPQEVNFDLFLARDRVVPGKTTRAEVSSLLGTNHVLLPFNKPGVAQRWHYGYSAPSKTDHATIAGQEIEKRYGKSVDIDLDPAGIVLHRQGESDFPEDVARK